MYAVPDFTAEWSLSFTELSTGYVAGSFTETSYAGLRPTPEPLMWTEIGSVAGEHRGTDIVLTFLDEGGEEVGFEGAANYEYRALWQSFYGHRPDIRA
ncbi:MAG: hypothetical protein F4Z33_07010 [Gemmatimonadales bacterium]|nr:hypothetical protein [Gemmatimonadales bacterium]